MSKEDFDAVVALSYADPEFIGRLQRDFDGTIKESGHALDASEIEALKSFIAQFNGAQQDLKFQRGLSRSQQTAQLKRWTELGEYTVQILKDTLNNAARAYGTIITMNKIMFWTGIGLLVFAA